MVGVRHPQSPQMWGPADNILYSQLHPLHAQMDIVFLCRQYFSPSVRPQENDETLVGLTELRKAFTFSANTEEPDSQTRRAAQGMCALSVGRPKLQGHRSYNALYSRVP